MRKGKEPFLKILLRASSPRLARLESGLEFRGRRARFEAEIRNSKRRCTGGSLGVYLNWNECHGISYLLPNHQSNAHLCQINSEMRLPKFLRPPESHRRNRSKTRSEISLVEGQGEGIPGGSPSSLLILRRCCQLSIVFCHFSAARNTHGPQVRPTRFSNILPVYRGPTIHPTGTA